jgi:outer membrane lipoprotein LolB
MPRPGNRPRCWQLAGVLVLALAGCVTTPRLPEVPLDPAQQRAVLRDLAQFSLAGRVGVVTPDAMGFNASMDWRQQRDDTKLKLSGPLGAGSLHVAYSPAQLRVTSRGDTLVNVDAEQMLVRELGFMPPFDALRYWIRGLAAPGTEAAVETLDAAGVLQQLEQQGWLILFERRVAVNTAAGTVQLPARLTATRDGLRLRLVVDRWRIK